VVTFNKCSILFCKTMLHTYAAYMLSGTSDGGPSPDNSLYQSLSWD
jgi:hypothetical protein